MLFPSSRKAALLAFLDSRASARGFRPLIAKRFVYRCNKADTTTTFSHFQTSNNPRLNNGSWVSSSMLSTGSNNSDSGSKVVQLKRAVREYGSTVIIFHVTISVISLGGFYAAVKSGLDVVSLVSNLPYIGEHLSGNSFATGASTFVVAYAVHKVFAPVRISITLTSAPFIVRYLRSKGVLKKI